MIRSSQISFRSASNLFSVKNTSQVVSSSAVLAKFNQSITNSPDFWLEHSNATNYDLAEFIYLRAEALKLPISGLACPIHLEGVCFNI